MQGFRQCRHQVNFVVDVLFSHHQKIWICAVFTSPENLGCADFTSPENLGVGCFHPLQKIWGSEVSPVQKIWNVYQ
jgi:hypothetical protein